MVARATRRDLPERGGGAATIGRALRKEPTRGADAVRATWEAISPISATENPWLPPELRPPDGPGWEIRAAVVTIVLAPAMQVNIEQLPVVSQFERPRSRIPQTHFGGLVIVPLGSVNVA